jgi:hypothetical protein
VLEHQRPASADAAPTETAPATATKRPAAQPVAAGHNGKAHAELRPIQQRIYAELQVEVLAQARRRSRRRAWTRAIVGLVLLVASAAGAVSLAFAAG